MGMGIYRFAALHSETIVGRIKMNQFGQRFQIDEKLAKEAQRGGAVLLEESEFKSFGFTDAEIKLLGSPFVNPHSVPKDPDEAEEKAVFLDKVSKAQARYIEIRQGLLEPHERTLDYDASSNVQLIRESIEEKVED